MNNSSTNRNCSTSIWDGFARATTLEEVFVGAVMTTSLVLNVLLLTTICSSRLLRTSTHIFISSLAVSDIFTAIYGLARLAIISMINDRCIPMDARRHFDKFLYMSYVINTLSSYMNILIVSGERWLFISRPFLHQRLISRRFSFLGVTVAWVSSLVVNLDGFAFSLRNYWIVAYFKAEVAFPCFHLILTAVLMCIYIHLTIITRKQMHAIRKTDYLHQSNNDGTRRHVSLNNTKLKELRETLRSIRLLVTVFGGFVLLLSPGIYYHFCVRFFWGNQEYEHVHEGFKLLTYSHACMNFIVFASLDRCFRGVLRSWVRRATCQQARAVGDVQVATSVCRGCPGACKVGVDDTNYTVANPTSAQGNEGL